MLIRNPGRYRALSLVQVGPVVETSTSTVLLCFFVHLKLLPTPEVGAFATVINPPAYTKGRHLGYYPSVSGSFYSFALYGY